MKPRLTNRRTLAALDKTSMLFEIPVSQIVGRRRLSVAIPARQALCAALYNTCLTTMQELGSLVGKRHHATILYHIHQAEQRAAGDAEYAAALDAIAEAARS